MKRFELQLRAISWLVAACTFQVIREEVTRNRGFLDEAGAFHERSELLNFARICLRDGRFLAKLILGELYGWNFSERWLLTGLCHVSESVSRCFLPHWYGLVRR